MNRDPLSIAGAPVPESAAHAPAAGMLSVVVLTKDEEQDLPRCLRALAWCDDIHVVDSGSTDRTCAVATQMGARLHQRPFDSFAGQRNWAIDHCELHHAWVLFLDADEEATPAFAEAVAAAVGAAPAAVAGYYCCWKMMLGEHWLKRSDSFPKWQLRLLRRGRVRFIDVGHGQKEGATDGRLDYVREPYLHHAFSKGWYAWLARHNRYSDLEARERSQHSAPLKDVFSRHGSVRNPALKHWLTRVPGWPFWRFVHAYVLSGGFLDGKPGFDYAVLLAHYEFTIKLKMNRTYAAKDRSRVCDDAPPR